jgi:hypothetical protein
MKDSDNLQVIDFALNKVYNGSRITKQDLLSSIQSKFPNFNKFHLDAIVNKLDADKLIRFVNGDTFIISFDGMIYHEQGGYTEDNRRKTKAATLQTLAIWVTAVGTALAGLYGLYELAKVMFCSKLP